jgi:hypothetical protein
MLGVLEKFNSTAVPVEWPQPDPNANPDFHMGFWQPWVHSSWESANAKKTIWDQL